MYVGTKFTTNLEWIVIWSRLETLFFANFTRSIEKNSKGPKTSAWRTDSSSKNNASLVSLITSECSVLVKLSDDDSMLDPASHTVRRESLNSECDSSASEAKPQQSVDLFSMI